MGKEVNVICEFCTFEAVVPDLIEGVTLLAQHTIACHVEIADGCPVVELWRDMVHKEAKFNGHNKVSSEGIFY